MRVAGSEMPQAKDDAASRKSALLARLAASPHQLAAARAALPGTPEARLEALLDEIDETVLPRVLHVTSGSRETARLIVSHRRLIGIETQDRPKPKADPDALAQVFAAGLAQIALWRGALSLSVSPRTAPPGRAERACSVAAIRQALALPPPENACDRLQRLVEAEAVARLHWSGNSPQARFSGTQAWRATLQMIAANYLKMQSQTRANVRTGPLRTEGLLIPVGTDLGIVVASFDRQGFAAVLSRQTGLDLIAAWQSRG